MTKIKPKDKKNKKQQPIEDRVRYLEEEVVDDSVRTCDYITDRTRMVFGNRRHILAIYVLMFLCICIGTVYLATEVPHYECNTHQKMDVVNVSYLRPYYILETEDSQLIEVICESEEIMIDRENISPTYKGGRIIFKAATKLHTRSGKSIVCYIITEIETCVIK